MITLDQLKDNYITPVLQKTELPFIVFTDAGDWKNAFRRKNTVTEYINGLFQLTQSEIQNLGGGVTAYALVTSLSFLVPCGDEPDPDHTGELQFVQTVRDALSSAFSNNTKLKVTIDGKEYVGGVAYSLPAADLRALRPYAADSLIYTCSITFSYLENAVNSSDVTIMVDGETIAYTRFAFGRAISPSADLFAESTNGEATVYAENSTFSIDLESPASSTSAFSSAVLNYIMGVFAVNTPRAVSVKLGETDIRTMTMILGECSAHGESVSNLVYKISLIPYVEREHIGG